MYQILVENSWCRRRKKEEGRRKKEEGRRKKEEGRRKKEEGRKPFETSAMRSGKKKKSKNSYLWIYDCPVVDQGN
jgi:hypothetical protein